MTDEANPNGGCGDIPPIPIEVQPIVIEQPSQPTPPVPGPKTFPDPDPEPWVVRPVIGKRFIDPGVPEIIDPDEPRIV
ncbi:MAG TPA: hypothetical protein VNC50_01120 [Planctomycetia bacterium]|nr:hypothetical protein [Planctomycetia bacterium]